MSALEFGAAGGGGTIVLAPILEIGSQLPPSEYAAQILPCVVRLFSSNDRATRLQLLHHLPEYIERLSDDAVNGPVLTNILTGFSDTNAVLREATVKSALPLAPRLTGANLHRVLLPCLKRCLGDAEPAVRVNTVICISRIAKHVEPAARDEDVLGSAMREMRDPFPAARNAALRAVAHCVALEGGRFFSPDTVARRVAPAAAFLALDANAEVREAAHAVVEAAMACLRAEGERMKVAEEAAAQQAAAAAARAAANPAAGAGAGAAGQTSYSSVSSAGAGAAAAAGAADAGSGGGYGSMVIGALGWAVSGIANRVIVSGNIDEDAANAAAAAAASAGAAGASAGAGGSGSGAVPSVPPSPRAARAERPERAERADQQPKRQPLARRLPAAGSSSSASFAEEGWGAVGSGGGGGGGGDDDDDDEIRLPTPPRSRPQPAAAAAPPLPPQAMFPVDRAPVASAAAPAAARQREESRRPAADFAAPAPAPAAGKSLKLGGAAKKVIPGAKAAEKESWDEW